MRTSSLVPGILLLVLLAGCGEEPPIAVEEHDLRPRFRVGDRYRVREERTFRAGPGRFPPAADIETRANQRQGETHVYEEEVLETDARRLFLVQRTYLTSVRDGQPTAVAGKTYKIANPYPIPPEPGTLAIRVKDPGGSFVPATRAETNEIGGGAARLSMTLLPNRVVLEDATWEGRDLPSLDLDPTSRLVRLESIESERSARMTWRPRGRLRGPGESGVSMEETLTTDLTRGPLANPTGGRIGDFLSRTEHQQETPVAQWKRIVIEVSAVSIESTGRAARIR